MRELRLTLSADIVKSSLPNASVQALLPQELPLNRAIQAPNLPRTMRKQKQPQMVSEDSEPRLEASVTRRLKMPKNPRRKIWTHPLDGKAKPIRGKATVCIMLEPHSAIAFEVNTNDYSRDRF